VYQNSILIKSQPDETVCRYLFTAKSLYMLRVSQHPSSGALKTVPAASSTGHSIGLQRGQIVLIWSHWREVAAPILWPVMEAAVTVISTPDDGCCDTRNMWSDFAVYKYLHTVASGWIFINPERFVWCMWATATNILIWSVRFGLQSTVTLFHTSLSAQDMTL